MLDTQPTPCFGRSAAGPRHTALLEAVQRTASPSPASHECSAASRSALPGAQRQKKSSAGAGDERKASPPYDLPQRHQHILLLRLRKSLTKVALAGVVCQEPMPFEGLHRWLPEAQPFEALHGSEPWLSATKPRETGPNYSETAWEMHELHRIKARALFARPRASFVSGPKSHTWPQGTIGCSSRSSKFLLQGKAV